MTRFEKRQTSFVDKDGMTRKKFTFFNMDNSKPRKSKKRSEFVRSLRGRLHHK